jgi:hypothetical protein
MMNVRDIEEFRAIFFIVPLGPVENYSGRVWLIGRIAHAGIFFCSVENNHGLFLLEEPGSDSAIKIGSRFIRIGF